MAVKPGYKQTEVGVIPEEWDVGILGDKTEKVGSGLTPTGGERVYRSEGRPFMRSQNVGWGTLLLDDVAFIDEATHETFADTEIEAEDVFLNITGASIGRSAVADSRIQGGNVNQHVCIIRANQSKLVPRYLNYFLLSSAGQRQIDSFQAGGNRQGLNFGQVRSIRLPLPKPSEQRAIAEALSGVDALLGGLDRLIAKKRDLKQAAMQQLFTGRTRLPGFNDEWAVKGLGELGMWRGGTTPSMRNPSYWDGGDVPWISSGDVKTPLLMETAHCVTSAAVEDGATSVIPANSIVLVVRSGILRKHLPVAMTLRPMAINQDVKALVPNSGLNPAYLRHVLEWKGDRILAQCLKAGTTVESIEFRWLKAFSIAVPRMAEQTAIAGAISDMNAELAALEARRHKTRALKQAMMQELLTGRTRLV